MNGHLLTRSNFASHQRRGMGPLPIAYSAFRSLALVYMVFLLGCSGAAGGAFAPEAAGSRAAPGLPGAAPSQSSAASFGAAAPLGSAGGGEQEILESYRRYQRALDAGEKSKARAEAERVVQLAIQNLGPDHKTTAAMWINLAELQLAGDENPKTWPQYRKTNEQALHSFEQAIKSLKSQSEPDTALLYQAYWGLGRAAQRVPGQGREAGKSFDAMLELARGGGTPAEPSVASVLMARGSVAHKQGDLTDARRNWKRALALYSESDGARSVLAGYTIFLLGNLDHSGRNYRGAEQKYVEALGIFEEEKLSPGHPYVLAAHERLVVLYNKLGNEQAMEKHLLQTRADDLADGDQIPLLRSSPQYPRKALSRATGGWVSLAFTIDENGRVQDAVVMESEPAGVFDESALAALAQWRYRPRVENGVRVPRENVTVVVSYDIQK